MSASVETQDRLRALVREVKNYPKPGINFRDITPLIGDASGFALAVVNLITPWRDAGITHVIGIESRGFIFGAPVALGLGAGFVPLRKPGKLPCTVVREAYALEYGTDALEMHADAIPSGARALVIDDVLATGGTAQAAAQLVRSVRGLVIGFGFLIELPDLSGRKLLPGSQIEALITF
jgi:adenine phosphoribosyltransferase